MRLALTAVTCFSWHLDEGTSRQSVESRSFDVIEDRLVFGIVDLSGGRRLAVGAVPIRPYRRKHRDEGYETLFA
jgi:hypothetical protein